MLCTSPATKRHLHTVCHPPRIIQSCSMAPAWHAICLNACNLPKCMQSAQVHAICSNMQSAVPAIRSACNLQFIQSAVPSVHAICLSENRQQFCWWQVLHAEDGSSALCSLQCHTGSHESSSQNCSPAPRCAPAHSLGRERGGHRVLPRDLQLQTWRIHQVS